jgi:hypothetical protein
VPISNWITVVDTPSVTVEASCSMFGRLATEFSTRRVIWLSISVGAAPSSTTVTTTAGKLMLGNCLIGSCE